MSKITLIRHKKQKQVTTLDNIDEIINNLITFGYSQSKNNKINNASYFFNDTPQGLFIKLSDDGKLHSCRCIQSLKPTLKEGNKNTTHWENDKSITYVETSEVYDKEFNRFKNQSLIWTVSMFPELTKKTPYYYEIKNLHIIGSQEIIRSREFTINNSLEFLRHVIDDLLSQGYLYIKKRRRVLYSRKLKEILGDNIEMRDLIKKAVEFRPVVLISSSMTKSSNSYPEEMNKVKNRCRNLSDVKINELRRSNLVKSSTY
jgi:hypothetical protein